MMTTTTAVTMGHQRHVPRDPVIGRENDRSQRDRIARLYTDIYIVYTIDVPRVGFIMYNSAPSLLRPTDFTTQGNP